MSSNIKKWNAVTCGIFICSYVFTCNKSGALSQIICFISISLNVCSFSKICENGIAIDRKNSHFREFSFFTNIIVCYLIRRNHHIFSFKTLLCYNPVLFLQLPLYQLSLEIKLGTSILCDNASQNIIVWLLIRRNYHILKMNMIFFMYVYIYV